MGASNIILEIKNIETYYDKVKVLNGISFHVVEGRITAILGNNGAGKSTALNTILGLIDDQPDKGEIYFQNIAIHGLVTEKIVSKGIAYVPEGREVFEELSVHENLMIGAYLRKSKKHIGDDLTKMYKYFPVLENRKSQQAGTLSGGEQQMLAIARALMNKPRLLILDEPSLGLSPLLVKEIFEIIRNINAMGITILLVEQNANMALQIADDVFIMENGRFVLTGTAEELRSNEDVQEFYLGVKEMESVKGYQRYKRKKTMAIKIEDIKSVPATFVEITQQRGEKIAMRHKDYGIWHDISWQQYYRYSSYIAHALMDLGVEYGDFVGIIGENCPEWLYMDMGIQMAGGKTVGIYTTSAWQQVKFIINHSGCKVLFAENEEQVDKWLHMRSETPALEYVIYWDKKGLERLDIKNLIDYDDFINDGKASYKAYPERHFKRIQHVKAEDTAILVYTSGTTGLPKGAMLTSQNLLWVANTIIQEEEKDNLIHPTDDTMSFLPLCHIFERMFSVYLPLVYGYTINFAESPETIAQNMSEIHPTVGYAVPRVWEKIQSSIIIRMSDAPWLNRVAFKRATRIGNQYAEKKIKKENISFWLKFQYFLAYWSVLYPLKYMLGMDRMNLALSGAAPISPKVLQFYHMLGITMFEGYGMTETSCLITISKPTDYKLGTVGKPIDGAEVKISEEGEIMVKHPGVIKGYHKNAEATQRAIENDWLQTGDIGKFDEDGFLKIVDRKKDLIITAGGKNIAPQYIENKLKYSPYINDAIVIGDKRKFLSAIIVLDEENVNKYARDKKIQYSAYADLAKHEEIMKLIEREVKNVNAELARVETVRKFTILDKKLYEEDGEVTPTMKVKRKFINREYNHIIEAMYS